MGMWQWQWLEVRGAFSGSMNRAEPHLADMTLEEVQLQLGRRSAEAVLELRQDSRAIRLPQDGWALQRQVGVLIVQPGVPQDLANLRRKSQ